MQEMVYFVTTVRVLVIITFVEIRANFRIESSALSLKLKPSFVKSELVVRTTFLNYFSHYISNKVEGREADIRFEILRFRLGHIIIEDFILSRLR